MTLSGYGAMLIAALLCLIVSFSVTAFSIPMWALNLILFILVVPLYVSLIYSPIWTEGDRNRNMVQFGHIQRDKWKGLKIGLLLTIPYLLLNLMLTLSKCGVLPDLFWLYKLLNAHIWPLINILNPVDTGAKISSATMSVPALIVCWLTSFYPTIISVVAYALGYKGVMVVEKLIYKNKPRKKRRY